MVLSSRTLLFSYSYLGECAALFRRPSVRIWSRINIAFLLSNGLRVRKGRRRSSTKKGTSVSVLRHIDN